MKRTDIADHSRAAFYLKERAATAQRKPATLAWQAAAQLRTIHSNAADAADQYQAALRAMWESLGQIEPKRFSPEGQALQEARAQAQRQRATAARLGAYGCRADSYLGNWQPGRPGLYYCARPDSVFRDYDKASPAGRQGITGYYTDSDCDSVCLPMVAQLTGRDGLARYVAGYAMPHDESGAVFDLGTIHSDTDAADAKAEAERAAHGLAEAAAEAERDYQEAWRAGSTWADLGETIAQARASALALLAERRAAMAPAQEIPAICRALRDSVTAWRQEIADARAERAEIAGGLYWSRHDESPLAAFAEGAGLTMAEARKACT